MESLLFTTLLYCIHFEFQSMLQCANVTCKGVEKYSKMAESQRLSLEKRVQTVKLYYETKNSRETCRRLKQLFPDWKTCNPQTVLNTVKRFEDTGSVGESKKQLPKPVRTGSTEERVLAALRQSPKKSTRRLSAQTGISRRTLQRIIKSAGLHPYCPRLLHALNEDDPDRRLEFCEWFLEQCRLDEQFCDRILWSDEAQFKLNGHVNRHNSVYWASENPHEVLEKEVNSPGVMCWVGISSSGIVGPFFFRETVTGDSYLQLLQNEVWGEIADWPDIDAIIFQQDGAPPHFARQVKDWLHETFPGRWLGRGGPYDWPPRSPDLTPVDFSVWGIVKEMVYSQRTSSLEELKEAIENAFAHFDAHFCSKICRSVADRCTRCISQNGGHFENR